MLLPLLWKDIRLNKYVILLTVFLVDTPYVTTIFGLSAFTGDPETHTTLTERLSIAFPFSLIFLAVASAFIGGYPVTAEKAERTDRFLAYLPPTRLQVVMSKVFVALGLLLLAWIGPAIVYYFYVRPTVVTTVFKEGAQVALYYAMSASLILFGLAWLASFFVRSSTVCGLVALFGWLAVMTTIRRLSFAVHHRRAETIDMVQSLLWLSIAIAVISLLVGIGLSLRAPAD